MKHPDLHQLANKRGYGSATKSLKASGHWDEWGGLKEREFTIRYEATAIVDARSAAEARQKAERELPDDAEIYEVEEVKPRQ